MPEDESDPLAVALAALARRLVADEESLHGALTSVATLARDLVPGCSAASITLFEDGKPRTIAFSDGSALRVDEAQYDNRAGPCLMASDEMRVVRVDSLQNDTRWKAVGDEAEAHGLLSSLSLPLVVGGSGTGALNLYSDQEANFDDDAENVATIFSTHAAVVLSNSQAYWAAHELTHHLNIALESRAVIEQAKGVLVARERCTPDEAFEMLRRASQRENRKLREIAEDLVARNSQKD